VVRVLILGGTGFLGLPIARRLLGSGHEVTIFHRGTGAMDLPKGVGTVLGDRNQLDRSADDFRRLRPDVVIDCIAFTQWQAESFVHVFREVTRRVVVLSSGDVYRANDIVFGRVSGALEPTPLAESSPLRERLYPYRGVPIPQAYGVDWDDYDKILVERVALSDGDLPATVLRLPMVYGPGAREAVKRRFFAYLKRLDDRRPAILLDERTARWRAPWGYTGDVAEAVRLVVENERTAGEIYNVGESDGLDIQSWIRELAAVVGWRGQVVVVDEPCPPPNIPRQLNLGQHLDMDTTKIRHDLGYHETMSRREALEKTVVWDREHPPKDADPAQFDYVAEDAILSRATATSPGKRAAGD
jgi:nucleoside-diphosphate-sugar epimerase